MKDIYKNTVLYYVLVPAILGLWPLLNWTVYLPGARENWQNEKKQYNKAQKTMDEILTLDPDRLEESKKGAAEFSYSTVVDKTANRCSIKENDYTISSKPTRDSGGQKTQECHAKNSD